jgi:hypothetical protein
VLLALAYGLLNWDRAVTVLLPCERAKTIRAQLGMGPPPTCVDNVLFGSNCSVTEDDITAFTDASRKAASPKIQAIFAVGKKPDVSVYCPKQ